MAEGSRNTSHGYLIVAAVFIAAGLALPAHAAASTRVLLKVDPCLDDPERYLTTELAPVHAQLGLTRLESIPLTPSGNCAPYSTVYRLEIRSTLNEAISAYRGLPGIIYIEEDAPVRASFTPDDPNYAAQWHWPKIHADTAWDIDTTTPLYGGDPGVTVAIIDTGIAYEQHTSGSVTYAKAPDFAQTQFAAGYDFVGDNTHANDDNGHGTHVASTIAESTNNTLLGAGLAFNSTLMPIKVLDGNGIGSMSDVSSGIDFAVSNGADVVNLSLGSPTPSQTLKDAVDRALAAGVVVVAATGNESLTSISYPAAYSGVIAVTALGRDDSAASYANSGTGVSLAAPGGDDGEYIWQQGFSNLDSNNLPRDFTTFGLVGFQGTSQATPQVAGAAALLLAHGASGFNIKTLLETSADDLGAAGYDTQYGNGRLNVSAAFLLLLNDATAPVSSHSLAPVAADGQGGYFLTLPTITLTGADEAGGSGVSRILFQWDGGTPTVYTEPMTPPQGSHTLTYSAIDAAGNAEIAHSFSLAVDSIGPVVTVTTPVSVNNPRVTISGQVSDATSGFTGITMNNEPITVSNDGKFSFAKVLPLGAVTLTFLANDAAGNVSRTTHLMVVTAKARIISGTGPGGGPQLVVSTNAGKKVSALFALPKAFRGGIYVAVGDINGDGTGELLTAPQSDKEAEIKVFNNRTKLLRRFRVYEKGFRGGVRVAAGDIDENGKDEILVAPGPGRAPQLKILNATGKTIRSFLAFPSSFQRGVTIAAGDLDGDGKKEIIAGAGPGGGPQIRIFSATGKVLGQFFAFEKTQKNGIEVASGDVNGDGRAEIVTGAGPQSSPNVRVFTAQGRLLQQFTPYAISFRGGITIAAGVTD